MRPTVRCVLIGAMLFYSYGCGQKGAKLQKSVVPPDKTLFETGTDYLKKGQYIKSRLAFQNLIMTYADSDLLADTYFAMGDSFYEEGGTENLMMAEDQYNSFIVFFPGHPRGPDAQMKIISANFKMMGAPDRDQQYARKTLREINRMIQMFPDSDFVPIAKRLKIEVEENLALGDLYVGQFYAEKANYAGARGRFQEIVKEYQNFSGLDDVYFRLAGVLEKSNNPDEAAIYYSKIAAGFPFSKFYEESKNRLKSLGKTVPPVDTQLAALNQSRLKPDDGFSPLKPFIEFGKALGFVGAPDQYAAAKKTIAAEKIKSAEAAAVKGAEGGPTADDIQIETVLRKDASGVVRDTTKLGTGSAAAAQDGGDKKKDPDKKKKKKVKRDL